MKNFEIKNQNGRSMIEMLGVLAIIGVLSVGGIAGYSKAMMKYRINKTIEQITLIAGNVRSFFASQGNYDGIYCGCNSNAKQEADYCVGDGCSIVKKAKLVPDEMITISDGKIKDIVSTFGSAVDINSYERFLDAGQKSFYISIIMPSEACIDVVTHDWSAANAFNIEICADSCKDFALPISIDDAVKYCGTNTAYLGIYFE